MKKKKKAKDIFKIANSLVPLSVHGAQADLETEGFAFGELIMFNKHIYGCSSLKSKFVCGKI